MSDPDDAAKVPRVARFAELTPMEAQRTSSVPQEVADLIWSRKLMPVISLKEGETPFGRRAPIEGAAGITLTYAVCPPGTGPSLHRHFATYETFTVLKGRFQFRLGETGARAVELGPLDVLSVAPGEHRAFCNVSDEEGIVQVIISGGVHDMNDIDFPKATADEIRAHGEAYLDYFKKTGLKFPD